MPWNFERELARFGPDAYIPPVAAPEAVAYCKSVATAHYENFAVASWFLPRRLRPHFYAVYAYCRWADDLADETGGGERSLRLLAWWREELLGCYGDNTTPPPGPLPEAERGSSGFNPLRFGEGGSRSEPGGVFEKATPPPGPLPEAERWSQDTPPPRRGRSPRFAAGGGEATPDTTPPPDPQGGSTSPTGGEVKESHLRFGEGGERSEPGGVFSPPRHPVMIALRETIRQFDIPREPFLNLLTAFEQDQTVKQYDTFDQLLGYCANSANPVGRIVLRLFDSFDEPRGRLSDEICTGLQLANFWQDVARDAAIGRVYLPAEDLARFGVYLDDFRSPASTSEVVPPESPRLPKSKPDFGSPSSAFRAMLKFQVNRTRGYFDRGKPLLAMVPRECRIDLELFIRGGEAILSAIEKQDYDVLSRRPSLSKWQKLRLLVHAIIR